MTLGSGSGAWLETLRAVCREASGLDLRPYEDGPDERIFAELGPRVLGLLQRASAFLQELHSGSSREPGHAAAAGPDTLEGREQDFSFKVDALVAQEGEKARLSDLLEMAEFHISMKMDLLNSALRRDRWDTIDACHSALRGTRKALVALEHVACEIQGSKPLLNYQTELANSLQVRLAFAKFREAVRSVFGGSAVPSGVGNADLGKMCHGGSTALAVLVGRDAYPLLRARDRRQIRELQHKLLMAGTASGPQQPPDGAQVLADLSVFAELITLVNQREELVEHDRQLARKALESLRRMPPDGSPPREWAETIQPLRGRDADLDQLICRPSGISASLWSALLQSLVGEELHSQV